MAPRSATSYTEARSGEVCSLHGWCADMATQRRFAANILNMMDLAVSKWCAYDSGALSTRALGPLTMMLWVLVWSGAGALKVAVADTQANDSQRNLPGAFLSLLVLES